MQISASDGTHNVVAGRLHRVDGRPVAGLQITASVRRLRSEESLESATADAQGNYRIEYPAPDSTVDLVLRVIDGAETVLETVRTTAGSDEDLDLVLPPDTRTEFETLLAAIEPRLDGSVLSELDPDVSHSDVRYLARVTGHDPATISRLVTAGRHADATGLPAALFYGALSQGLPTELRQLALLPAATLQNALTAAAGAGVIEPNDTDDFAARLRAAEVKAVVDPPEEASPTPLAEILAVALPELAVREHVYAAYVDRPGDISTFWTQLADDQVAAPHLDRLRLALQLDNLTRSNMPVVRALLAQFDDGRLTHPRDLVKVDWGKLVAATDGVPKGFKSAAGESLAGAEALREYADGLDSRVAEAYPTAYIANRLATGPEDTDVASARFLAGNPEFDLVTTPVNATTVPDEPARAELAGIQRTFKIAPRYDAMQALRRNGYDSAYAIASIDRNTFADRVADTIGEEEARVIHGRATRVHATAANLVADVRTASQFDVPWLPTVEPLTHLVPNWEDLFGPADYGSFKDCQSIYSQAAYFVDLLYYLRRLDPPRGPGFAPAEGAVAEALKVRRSDLWDLQLSCDNTDLTLPYVDLVNELLESAVVPEARIPSTERQSSGSSQQLRIQPQHVNQRAYDKLRTAVYPWNLPLDLWREQTNSYLAHLGTKREVLLETLGAAPGFPNLLPDEQLGLDEVAARIIAGEELQTPRVLAEYYGLPASTTPELLVSKFTRVRALLDSAELRHAELMSLLETEFVNPGKALWVKVDAKHPYNTALMTVEGLDAQALDRLHRFVRLQRSLGWSAIRLDRVLQGCNNRGALDRTALRSIAGYRKLAGRLNLPVEHILVFYNPIETKAPAGERSRYDRLFLDPTVVIGEPGVPSPFALRADRTELAVIGSLDEPTVTSALLGILQVTDDDLAALTGGPSAVAPTRQLNLANLSALVRTTTLASALSLSIPDLVRLIELYGGGGPFPVAGDGGRTIETELAAGVPMLPTVSQGVPSWQNGSGTELTAGALMRPPAVAAAVLSIPADASLLITEQFLDAVEAIRAAGLGIAELDALLTARWPEHGGPIPADDALSGTLTSLRTALQAVYQQTARTTDETGEHTRKLLTLMDWDAALAQEVVATLLGTTTYSADLAALSGTVAFPDGVPVRYDATTKQLLFTGPMSAAQKRQLDALPGATLEFRRAVEVLHRAPRDFVTKRMKALRLPVYAAPLTAMPADYPMPRALTGKVYYDVDDHTLKCRGYLTAAELIALRAPDGFAEVKSAVAVLERVQDVDLDPNDPNRFLTAEDQKNLFDPAQTTPADRFHLVLTKLSPVVRRNLSETTVKQNIGQAVGLDTASADLLLGSWLRSSSGAVALQDFLAPAFVASDPAVPIKRTTFAQQLTTLALVHRATLAITKLGISAIELPFVFQYADTGTWLNLNSLPVVPVSGPSPLFGRLIRLLDLTRLRNSLPGRDRTLRTVFAAALAPGATVEQAVSTLSKATDWPAADLHWLAGHLNLVVPGRFTDVAHLLRLVAAIRLTQRLGAAADRTGPWLRSDLTASAAQTAWRTAKAKHTLEDWPAVAAPMQDTIRERQRSALVSYLTANPLRAGNGTPHWHDANGLHDYFLLDVEMGPTQLTSRIAQGIYSIQLFVQRCLLNLEPRVATADDDTWKQWDWMKQYRLWEANQKIFLYPENYFEPELRPDKSSFFAELETGLMQKEVTTANSEAVFRQYLERLADVSRVHPSGFIADYSYSRDGRTSTLVIARNDATPRLHYLRWWRNQTTWTPWEKVELDIDSEAVSIGNWGGRTYAFWPTFKPVTRAPGSLNAEGTISSPAQTWEIVLNWSEYRDGKWSPKKVSRDSLKTDVAYPDGWERIPDIMPRYLAFDPSLVNAYMFRVDVDSYTLDPVVWCHYNREFIMVPKSNPTGEIKDGVAYGRFRLSQRHGSMTVDPMYMSREEAPLRRPYFDPDGYTELEGWTGRAFPPANQKAVYNDWEQHVAVPGGPDRIVYFPDVPREAPDVLRNSSIAEPFRINYDPTVSDSGGMYFFRDNSRTYRVQVEAVPDTAGHELANPVRYRFERFYHPHADYLLGQLNTRGLERVLNRDVQVHPELVNRSETFEERYDPNPAWVADPHPDQRMDFDLADAYASYNWELFFHAPLLLAGRLTVNQRFAEAQEWFHRIFDPTDRSVLPAPQRFWRTKPFFEMAADPNAPDNYNKQRIEEILQRLAAGQSAELTAVDMWLENPFQPDIVARMRTTAYQKATVMKYLDNLIAWGDQLFRQDTLESINQATQLYILADQLLGRRPDEVHDPGPARPMTFAELVPLPTDNPAGVLIEAEHLVPRVDDAGAVDIAPGLGTTWLGYFRIPRNEKLLGYWDTVADRLLKIRSGQNIDGVVRAADAFGAVIDPAVLVRAVASGADLATVLDDISAPVPHYRFVPMLAKAKELAAEVKSFGAALIAALEKRDGEALARLRSSHELSVLDAARQVRDRQVVEAAESLAGVQRSQQIAEDKGRYYSSRVRMNDKEIAHTNLATSALQLQEIASIIDMTVSVLALLPELKVGFPTTIGASFGGSNLGGALKGVAGSLQSIAGALNSRGALAATLGGYDRRWDDWQFQAGQARLEVEQYDKQIAAAVVRHAIAEKELQNHDLQRANASEADRFMRDKYTDQELYDWMAGQLSASYVQAYQLAYDVAKRAERAYRHELGVDDSSFIRFGYWDSLHKGLLAGERLASDLNRMDVAFLEANSRELELSKRISLAQLDPKALLTLKETGRCFISLPEALFDLDTPGHYLRRIKNVAITVPCVAGPYAGVNLTATLLRSTVRVESRLAGGAYERKSAGDTRFRDYAGPVESIVTSTGQDDTGLFETNLHDERFLPFEGAGVVSEWQLSLPDKFRQFDYESITDVVLHFRYTARDGGNALAQPVVQGLEAALNEWVHAGGGQGLFRMFSARREFADQWHRFLNPVGETAAMSFTLSKSRFPHLFRNERFKVKDPHVVVVLSHESVPDGSKKYVDCYPNNVDASLAAPGITKDLTLKPDPNLAGLPRGATEGVAVEIKQAGQEWTVTMPTDVFDPLVFSDGKFNPEAVLDLLLVCQYGLPKENDQS
ncbi:neuraminidase-like domain-containing protein [Kribbella sp. NPDC056951]|uniref:Tc toxin subunit A-related protein n=1 Tax=Kribbella sp. NPDC056951 TaxID=3345978 RepID=UPI003633ECBD